MYTWPLLHRSRLAFPRTCAGGTTRSEAWGLPGPAKSQKHWHLVQHKGSQSKSFGHCGGSGSGEGANSLKHVAGPKVPQHLPDSLLGDIRALKIVLAIYLDTISYLSKEGYLYRSPARCSAGQRGCCLDFKASTHRLKACAQFLNRQATVLASHQVCHRSGSEAASFPGSHLSESGLSGTMARDQAFLFVNSPS